MHLILNLHHETEDFVRHFHTDLAGRESKEEHIGTMFVIFLETRDRDGESQLLFHGFTDGMDGYVDGRGGLHWEPQGSFSFFLEADRSSVWLGNGIRFRYAGLDFRYGFPDFSVSLLLSAYWEGWFAGGLAGSGGVPLMGVFSGKTFAK